MPPYSRLDCDLDASEEAELWRLETGELPRSVSSVPPAGRPSASRAAGGGGLEALPVARRTLKGHVRERGVGARAGSYERESNTGGLACKEGKWSVREAALAWSAFTDALACSWEGDTEAERLDGFFRGEAVDTTSGRRGQARARSEVWRATKLRADQEAENGGIFPRKKSALINKVQFGSGGGRMCRRVGRGLFVRVTRQERAAVRLPVGAHACVRAFRLSHPAPRPPLQLPPPLPRLEKPSHAPATLRP